MAEARSAAPITGEKPNSDADYDCGKYQIHDYFRPSDPSKTFRDLESWKTEVKRLTRNKRIVKWSLYTTPLSAIKERLGEWASEFARSWLSLGSNRGFFHKFLTLELKVVYGLHLKFSVLYSGESV